jgi:hypothetical protein
MKINDIFECVDGIFPKEALDLCNDGKAYIIELNPVSGVRCFQIVAIPESTLTELCAAALSRIDSATSAAILAGFEYTIDNETLHFSYDSFDQQNFADTANGALLALQNVEGIPTTVTWNGYRNHTKEQKGELVRLTLDVTKFLDLYVKGALAHKDTQMELGGKRKAIISNCTTVESIEMYMKSWYGE